jgi:hypothetical protein
MKRLTKEWQEIYAGVLYWLVVIVVGEVDSWSDWPLAGRASPSLGSCVYADMLIFEND